MIPRCLAAAVIALLTLGACQKKESEAPPQKKSETDDAAKKAAAAPAPQPNPERNAYFGETHIHTSWSVDAWVMGNRLTGPADAYKYAKGETIKHPMGFDIKIDTPLDFMGVTDHSEYVGVTKEANTPGSYVSKLPEAQPHDHEGSEQPGRATAGLLVSAQAGRKRAGEGVHGSRRSLPPCGRKTSGSPTRTTIPASSPRSARTSGRRCRAIATCTATSSSGPATRYRTIHSARSTPLAPRSCGTGWTRSARRATSCSPSRTTPTSATAGCTRSTSTTPPGGRSTPPGRPSRDRNERLIEIKQGKGQSETHPLLSPNDEFASYELYQAILGLPADVGRIDHITGSFARQALKDGIAMQDVARLQPVQVRHGRRLRLAQHRQPVPPGQLLRPARRCGRDGRAALCRRPHRRHHGRAPGKPRRADRRVGRGEHPRLALGRDVPQGDLRRQRPAHQGALLRRLGLRQGHPQRPATG